MTTRRQFLRTSAVLTGLALTPAAASMLQHAVANAEPTADDVGGTLLDYAVGIPSADAVREAGHRGVIRYVSARRPGAEYMTAKPVTRTETDDMREAGLAVVSCYQFGKEKTADWLGGFAAGILHATTGLGFHLAAGGPTNAPIYASIDDNPSTDEQYDAIFEYIRGWESVIGHENTGVYANYATTEKLVDEGLGSWYWQHSWNSPLPRDILHPAAHLHQYGGTTVDGVNVDLNRIEKAEYGAW